MSCAVSNSREAARIAMPIFVCFMRNIRTAIRTTATTGVMNMTALSVIPGKFYSDLKSEASGTVWKDRP